MSHDGSHFAADSLDASRDRRRGNADIPGVSSILSEKCEHSRRLTMQKKSKMSKRAKKGKQNATERCKEKLRRVQDELQEAQKEIADLKEKKTSLEKKLQEKTPKKRKAPRAVNAAKQGTAAGTSLILGDSVVRQIGRTNSSVSVKGFRGIRTEQLRRLIENKDMGKPDVVLLHVGTHDLKRTPLDYIMGDLHDMVSALRRKFPEAKLVLSGILRRADVRWERLEAANERFSWVAKCLDALFVDPNAWVKDADFARNGIFLKKTGGSKLGRLFCRICRSSFETSLEEHDGGWGDWNKQGGSRLWDNGLMLHGGKVWTDEEDGCDDDEARADANRDAGTRWGESDVGDVGDFNGEDRDGGYGANGVSSGGGDGGCDDDGDDGFDAGVHDGVEVGDECAGSVGGEEVGTDGVEYDDYNGEDEASFNSSTDYVL